MAISYKEPEPPAPEDDDEGAPIEPVSTKRLRWATQRHAGNKGKNKRSSIMGRLGHKGSMSSEKKRFSTGGDSLGGVQGRPESTDEGPEEEVVDDQEGQGPRKVYFNLPLPPEAVDEDGHPAQQFRRNKIRTAKYTAISFIPKNLYFQFQNIANVYFLFLIILAFFSIFGASNPILNAVPLIVIVAITAVKDSVEDYRRTILDNELNNSPVHRLIGWNNVNVNDGDISLWRRIKKATSRAMLSLWRKLKKGKPTPGNEYASRAMDESRASIDTRRHSAMSTTSHRESYASAREDIQMTPVPSPLPRENNLTVPDPLERPGSAFSFQDANHSPIKKNFGNLINPARQASGKARFHLDYWKNVKVGDFVGLYNDDQIPADIVILSTSDPDGACYVETKNLDGETNLKVRHALRSGRKIKHARDCEKTEFFIDSEPPQANLYQYSAVTRWTQRDSKDPDSPGEEMAEPVSINNMLLRGCNLRNTEWVLGVVIFTGFDTKIMINSGITPSKRSRISRELNWNVIYNFIILVFMCLASGIYMGVYWGKSGTSIVYFEFGSIADGKPALDGFITFWAAIILFQNLVPISLYISLEVIKTCQAFFIYSDSEMYYEKLDYPCTPKSWNISDDLGQIEYIFSDKTGTLTQNVMEFKKATINGVPYGEAYTEAQAGMQKRQGIDVEKEGARAREEIAQARVKMIADIRKLHNNPYLHDSDLTFVAPDFITDMAGHSGPEQQNANEQFMLALALCHTVIAEMSPGDPPKIEFKAQSPDEAALVATARDVGYTVLGNSTDGIRLNIQGEDKSFKVLNTLEFNSTPALDKHLATFNMTGSDSELKAARKSHEPPAPTHAIIIDGDALKLVLEPKIQADVGVGIAGEEGRQAVMSADYAIGQFRFLQRLVLVHGRWSYRRLAETIANFFYKNIVWTFTIFWYQIYCSFDQTYLYDYTYILLFNLAFTSLPVVFMGVLDQDVSDKVCLAVPQLYRRGIERLEWTQTKFWFYMIDGIYQSVVLYYMAYLAFAPGNFVTTNGRNIDDRVRFGVYIAPAAIMVINTYILLNSYRWDWLMLLLVSVSNLLVWFWTGVYSAFSSSGFFYKAAAETFSQPTFWAVTCLSTVLCLAPRFSIKAIQKIYFPYDVDIVREQVRQGKFDHLEVPSALKPSVDEISNGSSSTSYEIVKPIATHNPRSQNGSDGTDFTRHRQSVEQSTIRPSVDRGRPSYDRIRASMDRVRPSYERSNDFTSAALLNRVESSNSHEFHRENSQKSLNPF
ncbi:uncharacterized protein L3040_000121 [Drepanopeziza brunnea f. sp. 'multigermtubi']|uniref:uncharacterized protein n=1 Tax=Drepanopeziza brunnea f. sp. 'multigermtubi' TaxID=698441 RepID=UPI00238FD89F|nr:hypothetical protein L3040_000121 [Drepanopeziza brunnea f. sp. 'multigermtubi']